MDVVGNILLFVFGAVITIFVLDAAIRTFVVPRGNIVLLTVLVFQGVRRVLAIFARPRYGYERRDRVFALYAPMSLLALPAISLVLVFVAYAFMYTAVQQDGWREAFIASGSSLFTLGFERPGHFPAILLTFTEAAIGLAILALVIAYLPTIYNAFSRREVAVTDLSIRAGTPPTPGELLARAHITGYLRDMDSFWDTWFAWFTEIQETHTSYGALPVFRSPNAHRSWVTAAGAVLDTAAIRQSTIDLPWTPNAPLCIRAGFIALREVAGFFGFDYQDDPNPDDPISISRDEYDEVCALLESRGVPLKADRDQAWRDFAGWRVNYDGVLLALAGFVNAPYAPWSSDRSPVRPVPRYGWGRRRREMNRRLHPGPTMR
ncbi:MAG TPA: hypothetical protein VL856_01895 [Acidimicrobiia bacterium]|jgi:hypothetical protein|nr:hypothetical protein [Acidimicrobiia bacterium]